MSNLALMGASLVNMQNHLTEFCELLDESDLIQADMFELPPVGVEQEGLSEVPPFRVNHTKSEIALQALQQHIKSHYAKEGESRRIARRLPGLLVVRSDKVSEMMDCAFNIAREKRDFYDYLKLLPGNPEERHEIVHRAFPHLITLNVTRNLIVTHRQMVSARFSWVHKHSMKRMTKDQVIQQLNNAKKMGSNKTLDQEAFQEKVEQELSDIYALQGNVDLVIRRPLRVTPMANIRYDDNKRETATAHSPFIMLTDNPQSRVEITPLPNYETKTHQVPEKYTLVIPRLHLYSRLQHRESAPS